MTLTIHELATNAAKYGSLSVEQGRLAVNWQVTGEGAERRLQFTWQERSGPLAQPPGRRGFGSILINQITASELQCTPELDYVQHGLTYSFDAPLSVAGRLIEESPVRRKIISETLRAFYDAWARAGGGHAIPIYSRFDRNAFASNGALTVAQIDDSGAPHFVEIGKALTERLGRPLKLSTPRMMIWSNSPRSIAVDPQNVIRVYRKTEQRQSDMGERSVVGCNYFIYVAP